MKSNYPSVFLKKGKDQSIKRYHRWIFSGALEISEVSPEDGEIVEIFNNEGNYMATGHFQDSNIAVRVLSFTRQEINYEFWIAVLTKAFQLRQAIGLTESHETTGYRLVFGEGDDLPGLVIDYYNGAVIIQSHSSGMFRNRELVAGAIRELYGKKLHTIYHIKAVSRSDRHGEFLQGATAGGWFRENNLDFFAQWEGGQKTGYFLDQRENRKLLREYSKNRNILDAFSYSGGFAVNALAAKAKMVTAVDISGSAMNMVNKNLKRNGFESFNARSEDVMDFLKAGKQKYDTIIIDPPAFAKHKSARHAAVQGYKRLNNYALRKLNTDGILFTFSCSQAVDRTLFENTIRAAAIEAGRKTRIIHRLSQPADHPVNIYHPEGEYLKGLVLKLD